MSLLSIQAFIQNNSHQILDYYIENKIIKFLKIFSRKTGYSFFVNVFNYNIPFTEDIDMNKYSFYFLEPSVQTDDFIFHVYQDYINVFPELYNKFIFIYGCHIYIHSDTSYQIINVSQSSDLSFYLFYEIEWFYENTHTISFEVEKIYLNIYYKLDKQYEILMNQFICNQEILETFQKYKTMIGDLHVNYRKIIQLYLKMCLFEDKCNDILISIQNSASTDGFQETLFKSQQKKIYLEKLNKIQVLYIKVFDKISHYHHSFWKLQIKLLYFMSNFMKHNASIRSIHLEMNDLLTSLYGHEC